MNKRMEYVTLPLYCDKKERKILSVMLTLLHDMLHLKLDHLSAELL